MSKISRRHFLEDSMFAAAAAGAAAIGVTSVFPNRSSAAVSQATVASASPAAAAGSVSRRVATTSVT